MGRLTFLCPPRLAQAELVVVQGSNAQAGRRVAITFLLRSYRLSRQNVFAEQAIPGLPGAPLQFVRSQPEVLSLDIVFDARAADRDVRDLTNDVLRLMKIDAATHAPPVLRFEWRGSALPCVLESATERITALFPDGRPSRATVHTSFKELRTVAELLQELDRE